MSVEPSPIALIDRACPGPVLVGFSGGVDSTALLHLLASDDSIRTAGLRAIHVHHGLQADADRWAAHCETACAGLGVPLSVVRVVVDRDSGMGLEAAARQARRAAFAAALAAGEHLALAQHRDDQAETFLLRALRASGPDGLAAMRPCQRFAAGWMWRPLLDTPRAAIEDYAARSGLRWIDDPSNADIAFDRNFLRHRVLPLLRERWPQADAAFARSAALCRESSDLLLEQDAAALAVLRADGDALPVERLRALAPAARARLLRHWVTRLGWPPLPAEGVSRIERDLIAPTTEHFDRIPCFAWHGVGIRRWRDALYPLAPDRDLPRGWSCEWDGRAPLDLPNGDRLQLQGADAFPAPVRVHARRGGEKIRLPGRVDHRHTLKHVLQSLGIPPWERFRMPLLSTEDDDLIAAGDRIHAADFEQWLHEHDAALVWLRDAPGSKGSSTHITTSSA